MPAASIGRVHGGHGNFLVVVRALAYMRALGGPGLRRVAERSVLNARYLESLIAAEYDLPYRAPLHARVRGLGRPPEAGHGEPGGRRGQGASSTSASTPPPCTSP